MKKILMAAIAAALLATGPAYAKAKHHHRHVANHSHRSLVALINYKLARYVHPTGKCFGSEWLATYYWQGTRTATGARFNPHGLTAAHRHLPFGTRLSVKNPHNGRQVEVVINDRGPYTNANIDLSLGAARALGMTQSSYICVTQMGVDALATERHHKRHRERIARR